MSTENIRWVVNEERNSITETLYYVPEEVSRMIFIDLKDGELFEFEELSTALAQWKAKLGLKFN